MPRLYFPCLLLLALSSACQRTPQTAAELRDRLPKRFIGDAHWQGEPQAQPIRVQARDLTVRSEHLLEFNGVHVQVLDAQGGSTEERDAAVRGTISAPGLEIRLEEIPGGEDMIKPDSFHGKLSPNLQTMEATWTSSFGGRGSLTLRAEP